MEVRAEVSKQKLPLRAAVFPCLLAVWNRIREPVAMRRGRHAASLPRVLEGEEALWADSAHAVLRIAESVRKGPGLAAGWWLGPGGPWECWSCPRVLQAEVSVTCAHSCLE